MKFSVLDAQDKTVFESDCILDACKYLRTSGLTKGRAVRNESDGTKTDMAIKDDKYDANDYLGG